MSEDHSPETRTVSRRELLRKGAVVTTVAGLGLSGSAGSAAATKKKEDAIPIDGPTLITEPGYYVLTQDIDVTTNPVPERRRGVIEISPGVSNVTIDGQGYTLRGEDRTGFDIAGVSALGTAVDSKSQQIHVKDLCVTNIFTGISFRNVKHSDIRRVKSFGNFFGVDCVLCDSISLEANVFKENTVGLSTQGVGRYTVCRNSFTENNQGAIINNGSVDLLFKRNKAQKNGNALFISEGSTNPTIVDNTFINNFRGIFLEARGGVINNNSVTGHENTGIELVLSEDVLVKKNRVHRNEDGIVLVFEANNNTVRKNMISDNRGDGIFIFGSDENHILKNIIRNNGDDGIEIRSRIAGGVTSGSDNNVIRKNIIIGNAGLPIRIDEFSTGNVIEKNKTDEKSDGGNDGDGDRNKGGDKDGDDGEICRVE